LALSVMLCLTIALPLVSAFKAIGRVTVTNEGLYTSDEDGRPFIEIKSKRITNDKNDGILTTKVVFLVGDYLVDVEHNTMMEQPPPVHTTTEDGITITASGILLAPTIHDPVAYLYREPDRSQHSEGSTPVISVPEFVCVAPSGRLRVIRV